MAIFYKRDADTGELVPFKLTDNGDGTFSEASTGSGGGAITVADGADVTLGAKADAEAANDTATASLLALFKRLLNTKLAFGQKTRANSLSVAQASDAIAANAPQIQGANILLSGTAAGVNADIIPAMDVSSYKQVVVQLSGFGSASIRVQFSLDGITFIDAVGFNVATLANNITLMTAAGMYIFPIPPNVQMRVRATAWASGTIAGTVGLSALPSLAQTLTTLYSTAGSSLTVSTTNDTLSSTASGLTTLAYNMLYDAQAVNFERLRVCNVFKDVNAVAAGSIVTVWTPQSGKKFNLMGGCISVSAACSVLFEDNAGGTFIYRTPKLLADTPFYFTVGGTNSNGILSAAANNVLKATSSAAANITGTLFGTEE